MSEPVVEVRGLSKVFTPLFSSPITAVDNFSCSIRKGEIVGLLGVNGAGKTTLLQMLLGTLLPSAGAISYFGKNLKQHRTEILERIGFAASYSNLPWGMKVWETLHFCAYLYSIQNRKSAVLNVVRLFDIETLLEKRINQLSSGQLARVSLAKAFLNQPELLFLDEPTNYLDPQAAKMIHNHILNLQKKNDLTVLLASHNMQEVFELCDKIILMHKGKKILVGKPAKIIAQYFNHRIIFTKVSSDPENTARLKALGLHFVLKNKQAIVELPEKNIGLAVKKITRTGLEYENIVITKPSLEAVFTPEFIAQHSNA